MMRMITTGIALVAAAFCSALPANAATLNFVLSGSRSASFQLDSNPVPDAASTFLGTQIQFFNVTGIFGGTPGVASSISFGTSPIYSQLDISSTPLGFTQFTGPTLFTGTATMPVFSPGSFSLSSFVSGSSTLTISAAPAAAVPEPATWVMAMAGVGAAGVAMRRRRAGSRAAGRRRQVA